MGIRISTKKGECVTRAFMILVIISSFVLGQSAAMAEEGQLWRLAKKSGVIKVFLGSFTNDSGQSQVSPEEFRKAVEETLVNRKSTKFQIVSAPADSDIQISAIIQKYRYLDRGPFKATPGIATTLLDTAATATANYVDMNVIFTVIDAKTNAVLWKDTIEPYAKKGMTASESIPIIYEKCAKHFVWKCFGKPAQ